MEFLFFSASTKDHVEEIDYSSDQGHPETYFNCPKTISTAGFLKNKDLVFNLRHFSVEKNPLVSISYENCSVRSFQDDEEVPDIHIDPSTKSFVFSEETTSLVQMVEVYFIPSLTEKGFVSIKTQNGIEARISWEVEENHLALYDFDERKISISQIKPGFLLFEEIFNSEEEIENFFVKKEAIKEITNFNLGVGTSHKEYEEAVETLSKIQNTSIKEVEDFTANLFFNLVKHEKH